MRSGHLEWKAMKILPPKRQALVPHGNVAVRVLLLLPVKIKR